MKRRSNRGLFQRLLEAGSRTTYQGKIRTRGGKRTATVREGKQRIYKGVRIIPVEGGEFETSLDSSRFDSLRDAKRFVDAWKKQGNPALRYIARPEVHYGGGERVGPNWDIIDKYTGQVIRTVKTKSAARQVLASLNAKASYPVSNPRGTKGRFERCVKAVSERGGAYDPEAVCAAQERREIGQKELTRRALSGKRAKARKRNPSEAYRAGMSDARAAAARHGTVRLSPSIAQREDWRHAWTEYMRGWKAEMRRKENPADAAIAVSEEFHGRKVKAMIPVQEKRHYHKYLAELGELRKLVVLCRDGKHRVTLSKFDGAMLCANEDKNQLFIVGGDQSVNLNDFGIKNPHETETLGEVITIDYFTDKEHLGDEGGVAVYTHKFRSTNDNGKHKTVRMAEYPDLIYHLRDEHLEFSGGSYEIRAEGIDL